MPHKICYEVKHDHGVSNYPQAITCPKGVESVSILNGVLVLSDLPPDGSESGRTSSAHPGIGQFMDPKKLVDA